MSTVKEEFEFCDNSGTHSITSNTILCCAETGRVVAVFYNEDDLRAATGLIKNVELIDGKAYQFDHIDSKNLLGFYVSETDELNVNGNHFSSEHSTNIQLLEVK